MTDNIKLPKFPHWCESGSPFAQQMQAYAREAVRLNAAPMPDGWRETIQGAIDELPYQHYLIPRLVALLALAAAPEPQGVPEQPTQRANRIAFERAIEALDELEAAARGDEPFPHFAGPLIRQTLAMLSGQTCDVPPDGWYCTREKGHSGPCAAHPQQSGAAQPEPERKPLNAMIADQLRPFLKPGDKVIWREAFRWKDDDGVLSNHYEGMELPQLAEEFGYDVLWDFNMHHAAIVRPAARKESP